MFAKHLLQMTVELVTIFTMIACVVGLFIWYAAADPGVFFSFQKYLNIRTNGKQTNQKDSKLGGESTSTVHHANASQVAGKSADKDAMSVDATSRDPNIEIVEKNMFSGKQSWFLLVFIPCYLLSNCCNSNSESSEQFMGDDGMFYCSLCEVEVGRNGRLLPLIFLFFKYSKRCRVCDKYVHHFDHHCRLILQWSTGILVLIFCFLELKQEAVSLLVPFVILVNMDLRSCRLCTILTLVATLPLVQRFFFHILLIKKINEKRDEQGAGVQQSSQMSLASSLTGLSNANSFSTFHGGAWCAPPPCFYKIRYFCLIHCYGHFDVVPSDNASFCSLGKKTMGEEQAKKKNPAAVKIRPWPLASLNAEEISKAAAEAKEQSKILQPVIRGEAADGLKRDWLSSRMEPVTKVSTLTAKKGSTETSSALTPLQLEARSSFQTSRAVLSSTGNVVSSPESSLDSPDVHPFRISLPGAEESRRLTSLCSWFPQRNPIFKGRVPSRIVQRSNNWTNLVFRPDQDEGVLRLKALS
ncbi:hypothetical protein K2173_021992 [Erythroxylum novogranatense]|uniref:Protein S-acyltransferase n=1 Tax=Erythroxylum novogranatense TaxID=1862640 RepID=A0AAV8T3K7_9ROSI|nr:hypothetical protein K2173_021992 [Erythroxylum novogranatense]